jgi:glycosyltransferase involved in cell wall biosynthesis
VTSRVSLALPVCNGERFIAAAVRSILDQTFADFELIITDNASTDATASIGREFAARDTRIRYVRNERNLGAAANFNLGFKLASGEFFKWCAHDDLISENYLAEAVRALDGDPEDVLAYGRLQGIDEDGALTPKRSNEAADLHGFAASQRFRMVYTVQGFDAAMFGLIRRKALAGSSLHHSYYGSDIALLAELALMGPFRRLPHATFYNREHRTRSINITDKRARQMWHDPSYVKRPLPESMTLLRHLMSIAAKQRHRAPLQATLPQLVAWAMTPRQLARYALDLVGFASPALQSLLRRAGFQVLRRFGHSQMQDVL